jgi:sarcosine oxidase subunit gamma
MTRRTVVSAPEPTHPLAAFATPGRHGAAGEAPLRVTLPRRDIVQVMVRRGREVALAEAARASFGLELPPAGYAATGPEATAIWIQPGHWLLTAPRGAEGALAVRAAAEFAGRAAVADQSHGRTTIAVAGPAARGVLARGCRLDLHPRAFGPGRAAATQIAHVGCLVHQADDAPVFELTVFATLAEPFLHWLMEAGAEAGVLIE